MRILIASDLRATIYNGRIFLASQHYYIIKRYRDTFGECTLCARMIYTTPSNTLIDATDIIDKMVGVESLFKSFSPAFLKRVKPEIIDADLVIGRLHSIIGMRVLECAEKLGKRCFAELMGDAWDAFWNHGITGKLIAPYAFWKTRQVVRTADYALYVTQSFLQNRYPCKNSSLGVSDVVIDCLDESILQNRLKRIDDFDHQTITLMTTAAVDVRYKGQEFVIKAIPMLNKAGIRVKYMLVGGGNPTYLKKLAQKYGVEEQVEFVGRLPLTGVLTLLDTVDIYVQPSLQEGLPRAVVEAMSRGCPVIGARTAGIPELVPSECVVRRKSIKEIAAAILWIANSKTMKELARVNFEKAKEYRDCILSEKRDAYYARILADK